MCVCPLYHNSEFWFYTKWGQQNVCWIRRRMGRTQGQLAGATHKTQLQSWMVMDRGRLKCLHIFGLVWLILRDIWLFVCLCVEVQSIENGKVNERKIICKHKKIIHISMIKYCMVFKKWVECGIKHSVLTEKAVRWQLTKY